MSSSGDCFPVAADLALDLSGSVLVHATVLGQKGEVEGVRYAHAWVEVNGFAIDLSNGLSVGMPAKRYRALGRAESVTEYPLADFVSLVVSSGHYGPWSAEERTGS